MYRASRLFTIIATFLLFACSNSEYMDEFGIPTSMHIYNEDALDKQSLPDTLNEFPASGFFTKPFTIVLPKSINCETGGFIPTKKSPFIKTLHIDSSTTIRCADLSNDSSLTKETIHTYLFEKKTTIPAVFITTDPNSLFDPDTGIYTEGPNAEAKEPHYGANYWLDKEIPIFIEFIETTSSSPDFAQKAGLKIFGNFSRIHPKKSVVVTFRKQYGENRLNYNLFPDFPNLNRFKNIVFRNLGTGFERDYIRDRLATSISEGLNVDYQRGRFVIVFYNGKYFGIHDMRERSNEYYFETHYGINHNNINLLKADNSASAGSSDDFRSLINWLDTHSLDNEKNYMYIASKIDIDNYINYMQVEIYTNNHDWLSNNLKKWNSVNPQTKWKWFLYDFDRSFGVKNSNITNNIFEFITSMREHTPLYHSLIKNNNFRFSFINRMSVLLQTNFDSQRVVAQVDKLMAEIESEILRDQKRWSLDSDKMDNQLEIIKLFAKNRPSYIIKHLQEHFNLGETISVTLATNGNGSILVHNLPLDKSSLTIPFFKDIPVTLTAKPQNGSKWSHWSDGDTNTTRIIYPKNKTSITAIFK